MTLSNELTNRGFIHQCSAETVAEVLDGQKRIIYHGVDPTADSIHAGNFAVWMMLRHFVQAGHKVILLVGGGTGMIGDPKPDVERPLTPPEEVAKRVEKLSAQAKRLLGGEVTFVNNHDWLGKLQLIDFLRDTGKHFTVNELIKKDAIATRLAGEHGISYTEFAYPLLQAYDYLELHRTQGCDVQVGGSDQWGNIIAGVELVRKKEQKTVYAITIPLIIDKATGKKFGKSEGNAVWLDAEKTTPFAFYQFWLNTADENVIDYLKIFTLFSLEEIEAIKQTFEINPGSRSAQKKLAEAITTIVHGADAASACDKISQFLFGQNQQLLEQLPEGEKTLLWKYAPVIQVEEGVSVLEVLLLIGFASSKREAKEFMENGAIAVDENIITDLSATLRTAEYGPLTIIRRGKKQRAFIEILS